MRTRTRIGTRIDGNTTDAADDAAAAVLSSLYHTIVRRRASTVGDGVDVRRSRLNDATKDPNPDGVVVDAGMGLFAQRRFERGELITGFEGELISHAAARTLQRTGRHSHVRTLRWKDLAVDGIRTRPAPPGSGGASYANDGDGGGRGTRRRRYANNAAFVIRYAVDGVLPVCFLRALRRIEAGEEILVSYGRTYWRIAASPPPPQ